MVEDMDVVDEGEVEVEDRRRTLLLGRCWEVAS